MRIGIITDSVDDNAAGIGTYVRNLVPNLLKIDKKNEYYLIHHSKSDDKFYTELRGNKKVHEIIIPVKNVLFGRETRKIFQMPKTLEQCKLDIVHETAQTGPFFIKSNFKKIVTVHDLVPLIHPETHSFMVRMHHKIGLPRMLKNVDKIISVSENTKKDIENLFKVSPSKIKVIYEAASDDFAPSDKGRIEAMKRKYGLNDYFIFVGSIEPRKNIERIIHAFNEVRREKNIQLVIVTKKGWKNKKIYKTINDSPFREDIKILSDTEKGELKTLYSGAISLLFVTLYEGFGLPVLEAMACGCPVIASNTSSIPEVGGNAATYVNPLNLNEIVKAMHSIMDNKARDKIITYGFKNIRRFSWKKAAQETLKIYEEVGK